jgi:hypothetical protein
MLFPLLFDLSVCIGLLSCEELISLFQSSMRLQSVAALAVTLVSTCHANPTQYTSTGTAAVAKARATALSLSPTSSVKGKTFDRFVNIWLENTDYDKAAADRMSPSQSSRKNSDCNSKSELDCQQRHHPYQLRSHHSSQST